MEIESHLVQYVSDNIHHVFGTVIRIRGEQLFKANAVSNIQRDSDDVITADVQGSSLHQTKLTPVRNSFQSTCSCPYRINCKHGAALAYAIIEGHVAKPKTTFLPRKDENQVVKMFGNKPANQYRLLPVLPDTRLNQSIIALSNKFIQKNISSVQVTLMPEDEIEIMAAKYANWNYKNQGEIYSISVKSTKGSIFIKCNTCDLTSSKLCEHQDIILNFGYVEDMIYNLIEGKMSYNKWIDHFAEKYKVTDQIIIEYFALNANEKGVSLSPKSDDIFFEANQSSLNEYLSQDNNLSDTIIEKQLKKVEEDANRVNAFMWDEQNGMALLKGVKQKNKPSLLTHLKHASRPTYLVGEASNFYHALEEKIAAKDNKGIFHLLKSKPNILESVTHYWNEKLNIYSESSIKKSDLTQFKFSAERVTLQTQLIYENDLDTFYFKLIVGENEIFPNKVSWMNQYFLIWNDTAYIFEKFGIADLITRIKFQDKISFLPVDSNHKLRLIEKIQHIGEVEINGIEEKNLTNGHKQIHIKEVDNFLIFEPSILYDDFRINVLSPKPIIKEDQNFKYVPEFEKSNEFAEFVKSLHPSWNLENLTEDFLYLHLEKFLKNQWFFTFFDQLRQHEIEVFGQENLSKFKFNSNKAKINTQLRSGIDWFEAAVDISFGDQTLEQKEWIAAIKNNEKYVKLKDGTIGLISDEWIEKLRRLYHASNELTDEGVQISKLKFNIIDELFEQIDDEQIVKEIETKKLALENYDQNKKYTLPEEILGTLRPYQKDGFQWLMFLNEFDFGGCLADDMGLGKTVQIISFLVDQKKKNKGTSLVVIPRSLLFNWAAEIEKFAPQLSYLIYHGPVRDRSFSKVQNYDLIISTYDTVSRDIETISQVRFNYIILDESQAIKNPNSQRYKAMRLLNARNKLAMTGTPIENNTFDLYAQFSFLNPGLFGSQKSFKDAFAIPIDQFGDRDSLNLLKKTIHPFLLRRTKENVAQDLPEKMETIIYCEMAEEQRKLYETLRNKIKMDIHKKVQADGVSKSKFHILDGLLKLRQICNSPELVDSTLPDAKKESVKINTLINIVSEDLGNHSALIFSQFVTMLNLIRRELDARNVKYAYLDGSTRKREQAVKDFMEDDDCQVFLLSLKAGNTGLNLTKADYVYIVDPWWNPAVEAQAIDRTHRIGQDKNIFAYKMICKDTIEEKIVQLQSKKKKLAKDLIQVDDNVFKSLEKEELLSLFD